MAQLDWSQASLFADQDGMAALQNFLAQNPPDPIGATQLHPSSFKGDVNLSLRHSPLVGPQAANGLTFAGGGKLSPPEISPSPPSSNETSPAENTDSRIRARHGDGADVPSAKRKNEGDKLASDVPTAKTRRSSQDAEDVLHIGAGTGGKTTDRRKEQNRNAQRAFRERKEKRLHELEDQVMELTRKQELTSNENANLRDLVARLKAENTRLSAFEQAFTFNLATGARSKAPSQEQTIAPLLSTPGPPASTGPGPGSILETCTATEYSGSEFAALVRSVQQHLGNAVTPSFAQPTTGSFGVHADQQSRPDSEPSPDPSFTRQASTSIHGLGNSPLDFIRSSSQDLEGSDRGPAPALPSATTFGFTSHGDTSTQDFPRHNQSQDTPVRAGQNEASGPSPNSEWNPFDYLRSDDGVGDLTFLNDWNAETMSFLNDSKSASGNRSLSVNARPAPAPTHLLSISDLLGVGSSSTTWSGAWRDSASWASSGSEPHVATLAAPLTSPSPLGSLNALSTAGATATGARASEIDFAEFSQNLKSVKTTNFDAAQSARIPDEQGGDTQAQILDPSITDGELDGLCELMKTKATCQEKTALLDSVSRNKPSLTPAVELLKARRRQEMEKVMSLAGGVDV